MPRTSKVKADKERAGQNGRTARETHWNVPDENCLPRRVQMATWNIKYIFILLYYCSLKIVKIAKKISLLGNRNKYNIVYITVRN